MNTFINNSSCELTAIALNYKNSGSGKSKHASNGARKELEKLINNGALLEEIRMYLLGNIYDRYGIGSGYYLMQQRFSMAQNGAKKGLESIAKELFLFYAVLVLGFTINGIKKELKRDFSKEELSQLTVDISSLLRVEYFLYLNEDESAAQPL